MKRTFTILSILAATSIFIAGISSCIVDAEPEPLPSPQIETSDDGGTYNISSKQITNMKYANIFREKIEYDPSTKTEKSILETLNIGQIVAADLTTELNSFMFSDSFTTPGEYYKYRIRFWNGSTYSWSSYTPIREGIGKGVAELTVDDPTLNYVWNDKLEKYILSLGTDAKAPLGFKELAVIFNNGTISRPFTLYDNPSNATDIEAGTATQVEFNVSAGATIDLQKMFSTDFLDVEVEIVGLVAVYSVHEGNANYTRYYWTTPKEIDSEHNLYIYPSEQDKADGTNVGNYQKADKDDISPIENNSKISVPSQKQPSNDFDISRSVSASSSAKVNLLDF